MSLAYRVLRRLRARTVTLSTKILVLLLGAVVLSLSFSGWMLFGQQRKRVYEAEADKLLKIASTASHAFSAAGLEKLRGPQDLGQARARRHQETLLRLWKDNGLDRSERWGRLSLVRYLRKSHKAETVLSTEGQERAGKPALVTQALTKAAAQGLAVAQEREEKDDSWLRAYAPLRGAPRPQDEAYFLSAESNVAFIDRQLYQVLGQMFLASLLGLMLALFLGWLLTKQITKPLRAFVDVMKLMQATGDFDIKIDLHPEDKDMSVVEDTFASLIGKVRESRRKEESSYWSTLQALVSALDVRDNETAGHSVRVTRYSLAIAERMRVNDALQDQVRMGALLHDIGKIGVPDAILRKSGKLTEAEWKEMKRHPVIGRNFLESIEFLRPATAVVYCHHERYDGTGYPNGLSGEAIPLAARIFAVADALDTITSERYYKRALGFREAREEIEASSGTHFDPAVVRAFLTIPEKAVARIRQDTNLAVMELERIKRRAA